MISIRPMIQYFNLQGKDGVTVCLKRREPQTDIIEAVSRPI